MTTSVFGGPEGIGESADAAVLLRQVWAQRGGFCLQIPLWTASAGMFHAVLGTNGAGKSSFFATLGGELEHRGEVLLHGRALSEWPLIERARHLGILPQHTQLSFAFSAEEVVALGLTPLKLGWREGRSRVRQMLRRTGCESLAQQPYPSLSGGERQRVNLARVLVQLSQAEEAPLLLLDEPTSAQDLGQQHAVLELARSLAHEQGYAVVAILHDLNQALRYCDHCLLLANGAPVASGAPDVVLTPERVEEVWGYRPCRIEVRGAPGLV